MSRSKPTVSEKEQMGIETFVFDYHGDAYGKKIEVALYEYVRPGKKIPFCRDASASRWNRISHMGVSGFKVSEQ